MFASRMLLREGTCCGPFCFLLRPSPGRRRQRERKYASRRTVRDAENADVLRLEKVRWCVFMVLRRILIPGCEE
jgi:hypothetical protein